MSQQHQIGEFTSSALSNLRSLVDANTIIGDPISTAEGVVIIPVSKVSFGYTSGGSDLPTSKPGDLFGAITGGGVTIQPLAFLVVSGGKVDLLHMQAASTTSDRLVNAMPGLIDKIIGLVKKDPDNQDEEQPEPNPEQQQETPPSQA